MSSLTNKQISSKPELEPSGPVAYFGPAGSFTHAAALNCFGRNAVTVAQPSIDAVFAQVECGRCQYGVVPIENSAAGTVNSTLDAFIDSALRICGEIELRVHLQLLVGAPCDLSRITKICAHPHALAQARRWLATHCQHIEQVPVSNNAEAARLAAENGHIAALAGDLAVERYGLLALVQNVEDSPNNATRFLVLGREDKVSPSGRDKTTIVVSLPNRSGALYELLEPFHHYEVTVTRIDARPSRAQSWTYLFFIDFAGHRREASVAALLEAIAAPSVAVKLLGSYPCAKRESEYNDEASRHSVRTARPF